MIYSDRDIQTTLRSYGIITPFSFGQVGPASYDVRLDYTFTIFDNYQRSHIDVEEPVEELYRQIIAKDTFTIHPGSFVLAQTREKFRFPDFVAGRLEGRSSLGRMGLVVHSTAGFFDPGFEGTATLEMANIAPVPIVLHIGMRIAQMSFFQLTSKAETPYKGKYQGQRTPTPSRIHLDE